MENIQNTVQLVGRTGADIELKTTTNQKTYARFSIAISESYKNAQGEKVAETQWHNVVAWGKVAENLSKYATKGKQVAIQGKLNNRSYEQNGEKKYTTEVLVKDFMLL